MSATESEMRRAIEAEMVRREIERRRQASNQGPPSPQEVPLGMDPSGPQSAAGDLMMPPGDKDNVRGIGANIVSMATGAAIQPVAGLAGLAEMVPGLRRIIPGSTPAEAVERTQNFWTYRPRSEAGQRIQGNIAVPASFIDRKVDDLSEFLGRGNPIASTAIRTTLLGIPMAFGMRSAIARRGEIKADIRTIEEGARELGVELGPDIRRQLQEAGSESAVPSRGESMSGVREELIRQQQAAKANVDQLYDNARATYAEIDPAVLNNLNGRLAVALDSFDVEQMPIVSRRMDELRDLMSRDGTTHTVTLNEIERIRQRINTNRAPRDDRAQNAALSRVRDSMDEWLDDVFHRDMIRGDPNALEAWRAATDANRSYRARFFDNRVLRQLIEQDTTVEQMRNWVFGSTRVGFAPEAAKTIEALKVAIGEDSTAFSGLRAEAMYNIVRPLMSDTPNFRQFIRNYDEIVKNNTSLIQSLSMEAETPMNQLYSIARAVERTGAAPQINWNIERALAQVMFGHQISQAGLRVNLATSMIRILRGTGESERAAILADMLGYNPNQTVIPRSGAAASAVILSELEQSENVVNDTLGF